MAIGAVFLAVAAMLSYWIWRLLYHAARSDSSVRYAEKRAEAKTHRLYGWKLFLMTCVLCIVMPVAASFLGGDAAFPAPHGLLIASRALSIVLVFAVFPLLLLRKRLRMVRVLHDLLGSIAVLSLAALCVVGTITLLKMYHR